MYEVSTNHLLALQNGARAHFQKIGNTWYARITPSHLVPLSKNEGYLVDFWIMQKMVYPLKNFSEDYSATPELLAMKLKEGFIFKF